MADWNRLDAKDAVEESPAFEPAASLGCNRTGLHWRRWLHEPDRRRIVRGLRSSEESSTGVGSQPLQASVLLTVVSQRRKVSLYTFPSDVSTEVKFRWSTEYVPRRHPYALLYFADGAYSFRCRDNQNHYWESSVTPTLSSSGRDPLLLQLTTGPAAIWHFWVTDTNMDAVYVVTATPIGEAERRRSTRQSQGTTWCEIPVSLCS